MVFPRKFLKIAADESGAVTVDWVVLTSAIVLIAVAVVSTVEMGLDNNSSDINNSIIAAGATLNTPPATT